MTDESGPPGDDAAPGDRSSGDGPDDRASGDGPDDWVSDSVDDPANADDPVGVDDPVGADDPVDADGSAGETSDAADSLVGDGAGGPGDRTKGPDEKFCSECGAVIKKRAEICPECGVRQAGTGASDDRLVAALLAILLGSFGAHKFYLNQTKVGIIYLCFFWTGIPTIIGIIEGVIYLSKSDEEFRRQYMDE